MEVVNVVLTDNQTRQIEQISPNGEAKRAWYRRTVRL